MIYESSVSHVMIRRLSLLTMVIKADSEGYIVSKKIINRFNLYIYIYIYVLFLLTVIRIMIYDNE